MSIPHVKDNTTIKNQSNTSRVNRLNPQLSTNPGELQTGQEVVPIGGPSPIWSTVIDRVLTIIGEQQPHNNSPLSQRAVHLVSENEKSGFQGRLFSGSGGRVQIGYGDTGSPSSNVASSFFTKIRDSIFGAPFKPYPVINQNFSADALNRIYWGLGRENKWMECIDGVYHHLGRDVFDHGSHKGTVEPGFIESMERSFEFVQNYHNQRIDANWYLQLHRHTCAHFNADKKVFLMGQEKVGVFRDSEDWLRCWMCPPEYTTTPEARSQFESLDLELKWEFGESYGLGTMTYYEVTQRCDLVYKKMSRAQITRIFNKFLTEFYQEVDGATTPDQKLWAIARLQQRLEWLHPVKDGTARTSTVLMNKNLTDFGFHPAILEYPHRSSSLSLGQWKRYLQDGLLKWEERKQITKLLKDARWFTR